MQSRREVGISMGAGKRKCCRGAATAATPTTEQRTEKSEHYTTSYNKNALNKSTGKEHRQALGNYFCSVSTLMEVTQISLVLWIGIRYLIV